MDRDTFVARLKDENIGTGIHYRPSTSMPSTATTTPGGPTPCPGTACPTPSGAATGC